VKESQSEPTMATLERRVAELEAQLAAAQVADEAKSRRLERLEAQLAASRAIQPAAPAGRLDTLLAISAALLVTREVEAIQRLVVEEAVRRFPGVSGALLYLFVPATQQLELCASSAGPVSRLVVLPGEGAAGRAFLAPRAMLMVGPELEIVLDELDAEQTRALERLIQPWPPVSALLAPLRYETQRLGALVLYGGTHAHLFIPRDLPFVQAMADLTAVALVETQQRERTSRLQSDLVRSQSLHAETQARLDAAQAQLLQSAKLAAVGELAASVAHEINNPLYAARNSLYLIDQDLPTDAPGRPFLEIAQGELGRIARIITRMRDFYRPARSELEAVDMNDILRGTFELVQTHLRHGDVTIVADLAEDVPTLLAHADQMRQVVLNLMLNACDAMPDGGTLRVATHRKVQDDVTGIEIEISDTGVGISAEHLPHLFEPFYTTKPNGTGLGLAISGHIITQHGGNVDVRSIPDHGTTFTIGLPAGAQMPESA
jgi:two-component system NtrC family sensor kinase